MEECRLTFLHYFASRECLNAEGREAGIFFTMLHRGQRIPSRSAAGEWRARRNDEFLEHLAGVQPASRILQIVHFFFSLKRRPGVLRLRDARFSETSIGASNNTKIVYVRAGTFAHHKRLCVLKTPRPVGVRFARTERTEIRGGPADAN